MMLVILHILRYTVLVNCRIGSLETTADIAIKRITVNCRIGSLEKLINQR